MQAGRAGLYQPGNMAIFNRNPLNFPDIFKISILVATCVWTGCGIESIVISMGYLDVYAPEANYE